MLKLPVFCSTFQCEDLFILMKNVILQTNMCVTDEHYEPNTERLLKEKQCKTCHKWRTVLKEITE
jgi:hypothetical protein